VAVGSHRLVAEVLPDLPPPQQRALELALALSDSGNPVEERLVAFAFLNALRRLAERNPLLLAVDDVQWLDASSLALLRYVLPRFESEPVAAVLTARGELPTWLRRDVAAERLLELDLDLGPLHQELAKACYEGSPLDPRSARLVNARASDRRAGRGCRTFARSPGAGQEHDPR